MTIPRRIPDPLPQDRGIHYSGIRDGIVLLLPHKLEIHERQTAAEDNFESLTQAFASMNCKSSSDLDLLKKAVVLAHPRFREAVGAYGELMQALIPNSTEYRAVGIPVSDHDRQCAETYADVERGLRDFILLALRKRDSIRQYKAGIDNVIGEYAVAVDNVAPPEPALRGMFLAEKIEELSERIRRKHVEKVSDMTVKFKKCRPNLPDIAVEVLRTWFAEHDHHPYPDEEEKAQLAAQSGISRQSVSNWFINIRKRFWNKRCDGTTADV